MSLSSELIWLPLTPGAGSISKRVITGPGIDADHLHLDAEVLELELDLARQRFQRLFGIALGLRLRVVQQRQRRQVRSPTAELNSGICCSRWARSLFSITGGRRLDVHRLALGALWRSSTLRTSSRSSRRHAVALPFGAPDSDLPQRARSAPAPGRQSSPSAANQRQAGGQGDRAAAATRQQEQVARPVPPNTALQRDCPPAGPGCRRHPPADRAHCAAEGMQAGRRPAPESRRMPISRSAGPRSARPSPSRVQPEQRDPRDAAQHQRQREGHVAEERERQVGQLGADAGRRNCGAGITLPVRDQPGSSGIGQQAGQQIQQQRARWRAAARSFAPRVSGAADGRRRRRSLLVSGLRATVQRKLLDYVAWLIIQS